MTQWTNPHFDDPIAEKRQFTIDDGYCSSAAGGSVPIPQVRVYSAGQTSYKVQGAGSFTRADGSMAPYSYQSRITPTLSPGAAFTQGFANGMNIGAAANAKAQQRKAYAGCMTALGWASSPEEHEYLRAQIARKSNEKADAVQVVIDSIPELAAWQANDPVRFKRAVEIDRLLQANAFFNAFTPRERFIEVVRQVNKEMPTAAADAGSK